MKSLANIRPFQLALLIIFGLFAVGGLLLFSTFKGFGGGSQIGTVAVWGTLPKEAIRAELAAISTTDKGFEKVTYEQKPADTFDVDLANAIASGNGPDLILINQEQLLTEQSRIQVIPFTALPQRVFTQNFLTEDNLFLTQDGMYGIPYVLDPLVLYYNKDILASAGVVTPPRNWEGVTGLAASLTRVSQNQTIARSTIPFGTYDNVTNARGILSLLFLQAGTPISKADNGAFHAALSASSASVDGISPVLAAVNFYTQFADPSRTVYSWNASEPNAQAAFTAGDAALYIGYASEEPTLAATNPNLNFDMSAIPQPQTAQTSIDYARAYAFAIPKASKNPSGALAVAKGMGNPQYLAPTAQALSMAAANRTALVAQPNDQFAPVYNAMALISQGWLSPAPVTTDAIFSRMISSINSGQQKSQDALQAAVQALESALNAS